MPRPPRFHVITVSLSHPDYLVFLTAVRLLAQVMRAQAPDLPTLLQAKLQRHDAVGLAEDYLDLVRWPMTDRHALLRKPVRVRALRRDRVVEREMTVRSRPPRDAARN